LIRFVRVFASTALAASERSKAEAEYSGRSSPRPNQRNSRRGKGEDLQQVKIQFLKIPENLLKLLKRWVSQTLGSWEHTGSKLNHFGPEEKPHACLRLRKLAVGLGSFGVSQTPSPLFQLE